MDRSGDIKWQKQYGEVKYKYLAGHVGGAKQLPDGNFILATSIGDSLTASFDAWLVKLDAQGDTLWTVTIKGARDEWFQECEILPDGSILAVGYTNSIGNANGNLYVVKFDSLGGIVWEKTYGGNGIEEGFAIETSPDGGFVASGITTSYGPFDKNAWIMKADSNGNQLWHKTFGTEGSDAFSRVVKSKYGGYYLYAHLDSIWGNGLRPCDNIIVKLSETGDVEWRKDFLSPNFEIIMEMKEFDDHLVFSGITKNSPSGEDAGHLVKLDLTGEIIWERIYEHEPSAIKGAWFYDFKPTSDGGYIITGMADMPGAVFFNRQDFWLVKVDGNGCLYPTTACVTGIEDFSNPLQAKLYPNPTTNYLTVELPNTNGQAHTLTLYNLLGQRMYEAPLTGTTTTLQINIPPGLYLYQINANGPRHGVVQNGKLVVE